MAKHTEKEHKEGLIKLYTDFINAENLTSFQKLLFESAIRRLNANQKPKKVENWVVKVEGLWDKFYL